MMKAPALMLAAGLCLVFAAPALARHHGRHVRHAHYRSSLVPHYAHPGVMPDVLVANPYGDVILDGKTGYHRSDFGVMVPDSEGHGFIATGRAYGSGLGANGLPGSNWQ